jgi:predicted regulator of amino acid metabolism with ACT domain
VGVASAVTAVIAEAKVSIRQIVTDDPDIYPNPKMTIILEKRLPGPALVKIRELKSIIRISIG